MNHARPPTARNALWLLLLCGCLISLLTFGVRATFGLFTDPMTQARGWTRESFAAAIALQNLLWGATQPIAGAIADRFGSMRVVMAGGIVYAAGMALMTLAGTPTEFTLTAGVLVGVGMGGASYAAVLAAFGRMVPEQHRSWALGLGASAGSLGQFLVVPIGQVFIASYGWSSAALFLALATATVPLLAIVLRGDRPQAVTAGASGLAARSPVHAVGQALGHGSYLLLVAAFFACGFQLAFITIHLPPYLSDRGLGADVAAWAIALVGLFNVVGAYLAGALGSRVSKTRLLSAIYFSRALAIAYLVLSPPSVVTVLVFGALMGLMWLSVVPLVSGLVATMFGTRYLATLFGLAFFNHQVGAFVGVWLGGHLFETTGSYDVVWWIAAGLSAASAVLHLLITERPAPRFAVAGA